VIKKSLHTVIVRCTETFNHPVFDINFRRNVPVLILQFSRIRCSLPQRLVHYCIALLTFSSPPFRLPIRLQILLFLLQI